jgi:hypothetical protein
MAEFKAQQPGGIALELLNYVVRAISWIGFYKKMHMIRHHFHLLYGHANLSGLLQQKLSQPLRHLVNKHSASILRTPNKVVANVEDGGSACLPTVFHSWHYIPARFIFQRAGKRFYPTSKEVGFLALILVNN